MKRLTSWIRRVYIRAVLFFIGLALRAERESRTEELRTLGNQISMVVDKQLSRHIAQPHRPSEKVIRKVLARSDYAQEHEIGIDGGFKINAVDLAQIETRQLQVSELPKKLLRGSVEQQENFFTRCLSAGGVSPWKTSAELSSRKRPSRSRRCGRCSTSLLALSRLSPRSLEALLKVDRLKARRRGR